MPLNIVKDGAVLLYLSLELLPSKNLAKSFMLKPYQQTCKHGILLHQTGRCMVLHASIRAAGRQAGEAHWQHRSIITRQRVKCHRCRQHMHPSVLAILTGTAAHYTHTAVAAGR